jgi:ABC-type nitrate/sulfonate/bicarbonate transport system substrate-binding protein
MVKKSILFCYILLSLFLLSSLIGCKAEPAPKDKVILQLNWYNSAEFIGYYLAKDKGFYTDANLDVTINEGGTGIAAWQSILDNRADFAIATFDEQKSNMDNNQPSVAVMTTFQIPPLVMFSLADSGIKEPKDMVGKKVGIKGSYWSNVVHSTLSNAGVDPSKIIEVPVSADAQSMLYDGEVDVWMGYAHDESIKAEEAGYKINQIFPGDYGVGGYEGLLTVNQNTIDQKPDMVKRFVQASQKGLQYAMEHPEEAAQIMTKWQPDENLDFYLLAIRAIIPLVDTPQSKIGMIDSARWTQLMGLSYKTQSPGYTTKYLQGN